MPPFAAIAERFGPRIGALRGAEIALEKDWRCLLEREQAQRHTDDLPAARVTCDMLDQTAVAMLRAAHTCAGITLAPMTVAIAALHKARVVALEQDVPAANEELALGAARLLDIVEAPERSVALRINCLRHARKLLCEHLRPIAGQDPLASRLLDRLRAADRTIAKLAHWRSAADSGTAARRIN